MSMDDNDEDLGHPDAEEIIRIVCRHCIGVSEAEVRQIVLTTLRRQRGDDDPANREEGQGS